MNTQTHQNSIEVPMQSEMCLRTISVYSALICPCMLSIFGIGKVSWLFTFERYLSPGKSLLHCCIVLGLPSLDFSSRTHFFSLSITLLPSLHQKPQFVLQHFTSIFLCLFSILLMFLGDWYFAVAAAVFLLYALMPFNLYGRYHKYTPSHTLDL